MIRALLQRYKVFIKYAVVGVSGTFIDIFSLYLMTEFSRINPQTDARFYLLVSIAFLLAVLNNYTWNRLWTFRSKEPQVYKQFSKFFVVALGGYILTQSLMWTFVMTLGIWYVLGKALTSMLVLVWNFMLNKLWTFKPAAPALAHVYVREMI